MTTPPGKPETGQRAAAWPFRWSRGGPGDSPAGRWSRGGPGDSPAGRWSRGGAERTLAGRYRLERRIGSGGMSTVWLGYDLVLGRSVAVKLLRTPGSSKTGWDQRVRAEARAAARLAHPNVAKVFDFGCCRDRASRRVPYLVMELLDGETLAQRLARGPVAWPAAGEICASVAAGVSASHLTGIVHRDIKPGNVMLTSAGVKVVDFGLAAAVGQPEPAAIAGELLGTPAYLAPERLRGEPAVPATDVYNLGLLLYHCLAGRLPWPASDLPGLIAAHLTGEPDPLPEIAGVPADVRDLCLRCLSKRPGQRPTADQVARALAAAAGSHVDLPAGPASLRSALEGDWTRDGLRDQGAGGHRRPALLVAALAAAMLVAAGAAMPAWIPVAGPGGTANGGPGGGSGGRAGGGAGSVARPGPDVRVNPGIEDRPQVGTGRGPGSSRSPLDPPGAGRDRPGGSGDRPGGDDSDGGRGSSDRWPSDDRSAALDAAACRPVRPWRVLVPASGQDRSPSSSPVAQGSQSGPGQPGGSDGGPEAGSAAAPRRPSPATLRSPGPGPVRRG